MFIELVFYHFLKSKYLISFQNIRLFTIACDENNEYVLGVVENTSYFFQFFSYKGVPMNSRQQNVYK